MQKTIKYGDDVNIDDEDFRRNVRMECHMAGWEVVDFGVGGQNDQQYVTFRKKPKRKTMQAKARFFQ